MRAKTGLLAVVLLSGTTAAHAFCGTYVGGAGAELTNHTSQLAVARVDDWTVLTMVNDVAGDEASFGLLIPVAPTLDAGDVRLVERDLLARLDLYTAPRLVAYTCEDLWSSGVSVGSAPFAGGPTGGLGRSRGCGGDRWWSEEHEPSDDIEVDTDNDVVIEDEWVLGEYTLTKIAAERGDGLRAWLERNDFAIPEAAEPVLDGYIESGSHFLALRVDLDAAPLERRELSPLQLAYHSPSWGLPLRAGAASSAGMQDLVIYAITDAAGGRVGIANYPEVELPTDCLVEDEDFGAFYEARLEAGTGISRSLEKVRERGTSGLSWATEYSWGSGKCDPCPPNTPGLEAGDIVELGFLRPSQGYHVTRLRVRYTPDALTEDAVLYETGDATPRQQRFVRHAWQLETTFPSCAEEQPDAPGACYTAEYWRRLEAGEIDDDPELTRMVGSACVPGRRTTGAAAVFGLPLLLLLRRRR